MKRILAIVLCSLLFAGGFVALRFTVVPRIMKNGEYGMSRIKALGNVDTLFVGSSMFRQGIDTDSLETENRSMFLLAYNGNQPWMEWREVENLLQSAVKINTLVVDMYAFSITGNASVSDVRIFQDASPSFTWEIYRELHSHRGAGFDNWYEMFVKANNEIFVTLPLSFPLINSRYHNGFNIGSTQGLTNEALDKLTVSSRGDTLNDYQCECLDKLIDLCRDNGIRVIFAETPKYAKLYTEGCYTTIMKQYLKFLENKDCRVVLSKSTADACRGFSEQMDIAVYDFDNTAGEYFTDLYHMSSKGRKEFSTVVKDLF